MKINLLHASCMRFNGVELPYYRNGYEIKPIYTNPDEKQIESAITAVNQGKPLGRGLNGVAYPYLWLGRDLVVKKYYTENELCNKDAFNSEFQKLDMLYEKKVKSNNIQQGEFAFKAPNGEEYLVSTRINGKMPDAVSNKFNKKNLYQLIQIISQLDKPIKNYRDDEFPCDILMHYDLSERNIIINKKNAGIIDFEYLHLENLNEYYKRRKENYPISDCNFSDVACLPSNLRGFEYRTLLPYLLKLNKKRASKLFNEYLQCKSVYHTNMSMNLRKCGIYNQAFRESIHKNDIHAEVLRNPDADVRKAEAIKMQIARFMYIQSPYEKVLSKINPEQIHEYLNYALDFFNQKVGMLQDIPHKLYYEDGLELIKKWQDLHKWIDYQTNIPAQKTNTCIKYLKPDKQKEISRQIYGYILYDKPYLKNKCICEIYFDYDKKTVNYTTSEPDNINQKTLKEYEETGIFPDAVVLNVDRGYLLEYFDEEMKNYKLFQSKLTNEHIVTLDEHLGLN